MPRDIVPSGIQSGALLSDLLRESTMLHLGNTFAGLRGNRTSADKNRAFGFTRARAFLIYSDVGSTQHPAKPGFEAEAGGRGVMGGHGVSG